MNITSTRIMSHAPDCTFQFPPTRKESDTIILINVCPCGYQAPAWDGMKGVSRK